MPAFGPAERQYIVKMNDATAAQCAAAVELVISRAGSKAHLARHLSTALGQTVSARSIGNWSLASMARPLRSARQAKIPPAYVPTISRLYNIPADELRPDLYGDSAAVAYRAEVDTRDVHSARLGGSIADRRYHCPGSYTAEYGALQARASAPQTSPAAQRGIALHACMERLTGPYGTVGELRQADRDGALDPYQLQGHEELGLLITEAEVTGALEPALAALLAAVAPYEHGTLLYEQRLTADFLPHAFGTADVLLAVSAAVPPADPVPPVIHVMDYKFGAGLIDAADNRALEFYLAAAISTPAVTAGWSQADIPGFFEDIVYRGSIIQPPKTGAVLESAVYPYGDLREAIGRWRRHCQLVPQLTEKDLHAGPWCTWCAAANTCTVARAAGSGTTRQFTPQGLPADAPTLPAGFQEQLQQARKGAGGTTDRG